MMSGEGDGFGDELEANLHQQSHHPLPIDYRNKGDEFDSPFGQ